MKRRFPETFYNPVSISGAALAMLSFGLILFLMLLEAMSAESKPYVGIIAFVILPAFLILGLLLIAFGFIREKRRIARGQLRKQLGAIDLNNPKHRRAVIVFSGGTVLLLLFSAFGSFKAYEYTESDEFCGTVCHQVMEPEYTAYLHSPHSKVGCAKCHIGSGADWYVKSKISGSYQLYSVLFKKYSRPIPTPVENLRPAQQTCEQCHQPAHFYGEKKVTHDYYLSDAGNTKSTLSFLLKIGGGNPETGAAEGIHWHMNIANTIWYSPTDSSRGTIPWIKVINKATGAASIYKSTEFKNVTPGEHLRKMDCIDCHNRPSHIYHPPAPMVNIGLTLGKINPSLPYIKAVAVQALEKEYNSKEEAFEGIQQEVAGFYSVNYPQIYADMKGSIDAAVKELRSIYSRNYFPYMRVSWKHFPNNIGHMYFDGCFRCHDGKHVNEKGKVLTNDCNICHTIIQQSSETALQKVSLAGLDYIHPAELGNAVHVQKCTDCHGSNARREKPKE